MDDAVGHEFTFLCYAVEDVHHTIDRSVTEHPALGFLRDTGLLREFLGSGSGSAIGATSDAAWPLPLQETWPYYIDGVSRMALELIDKLRTSPRPALDPSSIADCETYYMELMTRFNTVWHHWGSHAFFHHINAVFGYQPVVAQPRYVEGMLVVF